MESGDEARIRAEVAKWKLSELHENCMPLYIADHERLLRELDTVRAERDRLRDGIGALEKARAAGYAKCKEEVLETFRSITRDAASSKERASEASLYTAYFSQMSYTAEET